MLQRVRQVARLTTRFIQCQPRYSMADNKWKEREDAAENMYISQKEKELLKKLLKKVEVQGVKEEDHAEEFATKLKDILARHNVKSQDLEDEIINLHLRYD